MFVYTWLPLWFTTCYLPYLVARLSPWYILWLLLLIHGQFVKLECEIKNLSAKLISDSRWSNGKYETASDIQKIARKVVFYNSRWSNMKYKTQICNHKIIVMKWPQRCTHLQGLKWQRKKNWKNIRCAKIKVRENTRDRAKHTRERAIS
jgi:hypothetical protein